MNRETSTNMKALARVLIECIYKEESGERDGDGFWVGCDPINEIIFELDQLYNAKPRGTDDTAAIPF